MTISDLPLISGLVDRMQFLSARSSVIAENIANADSPGYMGKDLSDKKFSAVLAQQKTGTTQSGQTMKTSSDRHIQGSSGSLAQLRTQTNHQSLISLSGNNVSVESETMKLAQTRMEYGLASTVYRKSLNMIRLAVSPNR